MDPVNTFSAATGFGFQISSCSDSFRNLIHTSADLKGFTGLYVNVGNVTEYIGCDNWSLAETCDDVLNQ